jgi:mRNA-degrading endonuclease RelE of RelBE toxin-antitoxin system
MNLSEKWDLRIDPSVFKSFKKIPRRDAEGILKVIKLLPLDPYFGDIQKMKGEEDTWRRRTGVYQIFYKLLTAEKVLLVFRVERRTSKTY